MDFIEIFISGKSYPVPSQLTVLKATEYAGIQVVRGCGCRGGVCGACAIVYRLLNSYQICSGLACVTRVQDGMSILYLSNYPSYKAIYDLEKLQDHAQVITRLYPEITRCMGCNTCTSVCPQEVKVMEIISAILEGMIEKAAELSARCVMCGLCSAKCPAQLSPHNMAILCRRLNGKFILPKYPHVMKRLEQLQSGIYDTEMDALLKLDIDSLSQEYKKAQNDKQLI